MIDQKPCIGVLKSNFRHLVALIVCSPVEVKYSMPDIPYMKSIVRCTDEFAPEHVRDETVVLGSLLIALCILQSSSIPGAAHLRPLCLVFTFHRGLLRRWAVSFRHLLHIVSFELLCHALIGCTFIVISNSHAVRACVACRGKDIDCSLQSVSERCLSKLPS